LSGLFEIDRCFGGGIAKEQSNWKIDFSRVDEQVLYQGIEKERKRYEDVHEEEVCCNSD